MARTAPGLIKVLPLGQFAGIDGRPSAACGDECATWLLTPDAAAAVMSEFAARRIDMVVDYEHQSLLKKDNGQPAPAAGWITELALLTDAAAPSGDGLYAKVRWTAKADQEIANRQYRYLSPVFVYDLKSGVVGCLLHVGLTNTPALNTDALPALAALNATLQQPSMKPQQERAMNKTAICVALGLAVDASDETALTALSTLAASVRAKDAQIAALTASQFDAGKHIPLDEHKKLATELTTLRDATNKAVHQTLLTAALSDGRILPANEAYWARQPVAALTEYLKDAQPVAALAGTQTSGKPPAGTGTAALSAEELAVCKMMGQTPEQFAKAKVAAPAA